MDEGQTLGNGLGKLPNGASRPVPAAATSCFPRCHSPERHVCRRGDCPGTLSGPSIERGRSGVGAAVRSGPRAGGLSLLLSPLGHCRVSGGAAASGSRAHRAGGSASRGRQHRWVSELQAAASGPFSYPGLSQGLLNSLDFSSRPVSAGRAVACAARPRLHPVPRLGPASQPHRPLQVSPAAERCSATGPLHWLSPCPDHFPQIRARLLVTWSSASVSSTQRSLF